MVQLSKYVTAPYQGVSQAPPQVRLPEQAEVLEDCMVSIPQGVIKRAPFEWLGLLGDHDGSTSGTFERIEREGDTDALLAITGTGGIASPLVYLLSQFPATDATPISPEAISIEAPAQAYLNQALSAPTLDYAVQTIEDFTFVVNRGQTVGTVVGAAATRDHEALIWVREAGYSKHFLVTVDGPGLTPVTADLYSPTGEGPGDGFYVGTDIIAQTLSVGGGPYVAPVHGSVAPSHILDELTAQGMTVALNGSTIYLSRPIADGDFTVTVQDDLGGTALTVIKDRVQAFSDLPKVGHSEFTVRLTQQTSSDADDFIVKFVRSAGTTSGTWQETIAPGASFGLDPETMPVGIINDGVWRCKILDWKPRDIGDETLAPDPDFVGQVIQDIGFWRGRLALLSGEGIILSSAADPFRMYPRTLSTVLASDPIPLVSPFPSRNVFRFCTNFDQSLVLFGDIAQGEVSSQGQVATPTSTKLDTLTTFEFAKQARPQNSNSKVYFVSPHGTDYSTVYEMKVNQVTSTTDGEDMTVVVPRYVPAGVDRIASCPVNYLILYGVSGGTSLVSHLFRYSEQSRVQNAWLRWNLPEGYALGGAWFHNTLFYVLACKGGRAHVLRMDTAPDILDPGSTRHLTSLDMRVDETQVTATYNAGTDQTLIGLPYEALPRTKIAVRAPGGVGGVSYSMDGPGLLPEGFLGDIDTYSGSTITVAGDWREVPFYVGHNYEARHQLSTIYPQDNDGKPLRPGRTTLRRIEADVADTGYLRAQVEVVGKETRYYEFTPEITATDQAPSGTGLFSFPVASKNDKCVITFINDSHFRSKLLGFNWVAELNMKAQRI